MDADDLSAFGSLMQVGVAIATWLYVWVSNRKRVTTERIEKLEEHLQGHITAQDVRMRSIESATARIPEFKCGTCAERVTRLESAARYSVSQTDLDKIHGRIDALLADVSGMKGTLNANAHTLTVIHDYLLNHGAKP